MYTTLERVVELLAHFMRGRTTKRAKPRCPSDGQVTYWEDYRDACRRKRVLRRCERPSPLGPHDRAHAASRRRRRGRRRVAAPKAEHALESIVARARRHDQREAQERLREAGRERGHPVAVPIDVREGVPEPAAAVPAQLSIRDEVLGGANRRLREAAALGTARVEQDQPGVGA